jgi:aromatic-L-amino-acid decarboxylase
VIDYRDWAVPLGRRFRALKLWWVLRSFGVEGLRRMIRNQVAWARERSDRIDADPRIETIAPTIWGLVSFRHVAGDDATAALVDAINASDDAYVTPSVIDDQAFIRVAIGSTWATKATVDRLWSIIDAHAI